MSVTCVCYFIIRTCVLFLFFTGDWIWLACRHLVCYLFQLKSFFYIYMRTNLCRPPCFMFSFHFSFLMPKDELFNLYSEVDKRCQYFTLQWHSRVCLSPGGGGEEAQSLFGLQLSRASESNLLCQLWQLHGAPALAKTRCQGIVWAKEFEKEKEEHMLPGHYFRVSCTVRYNTLNCTTPTTMPLSYEPGEVKTAHISLLCSLYSITCLGALTHINTTDGSLLSLIWTQVGHSQKTSFLNINRDMHVTSALRATQNRSLDRSSTCCSDDCWASS